MQPVLNQQKLIC